MFPIVTVKQRRKSLSERHFCGTICTYIYSFRSGYYKELLKTADLNFVKKNEGELTAMQTMLQSCRAEQSRAEQSRAWVSCGLFPDKIIYDDG